MSTVFFLLLATSLLGTHWEMALVSLRELAEIVLETGLSRLPVGQVWNDPCYKESWLACTAQSSLITSRLPGLQTF